MKKALSLTLALILCLLLCACGVNNESTSNTDTFTKPDNYAMVMLVSINPQIRLYIDENGVVLAVEPINDDAKEVIANITFKDLDYQKVVSEFVSVANSKGYIKEDANIEFEVVENINNKMNVEEVLNNSSVSAKDAAENLGVSIEVISKPYSLDDMPDHIHSFADATCTTPKTCATCNATEGEALGHNYKDAACTAPKTCSTCGATEGEALGHNYKDATCTEPKTCSTCGETDGDALGHSYNKATCTKAETCHRCGSTKGSALGHSYKDATCTAPKTCYTCGATEGNALGHTHEPVTCTEGATCTVCGTVISAAGHNYTDATCTAPKTCATCGTTEGSALGHSWKDATCTAPKTCATCGTTEGSVAEHNYQNGACTGCGAVDLTAPVDGEWFLEGLNNDGTEYERMHLTFDGETASIIIGYYGKLEYDSQEMLDAILENGYYDGMYYYDIVQYDGVYYHSAMYGAEAEGTYSTVSEGVTEVKLPEMEGSRTGTLYLSRTSATSLYVAGIEGDFFDEIVREVLNNSRVFTKIG